MAFTWQKKECYEKKYLLSGVILHVLPYVGPSTVVLSGQHKCLHWTKGETSSFFSGEHQHESLVSGTWLGETPRSFRRNPQPNKKCCANSTRYTKGSDVRLSINITFSGGTWFTRKINKQVLFNYIYIVVFWIWHYRKIPAVQKRSKHTFRRCKDPINKLQGS